MDLKNLVLTQLGKVFVDCLGMEKSLQIPSKLVCFLAFEGSTLESNISGYHDVCADESVNVNKVLYLTSLMSLNAS